MNLLFGSGEAFSTELVLGEGRIEACQFLPVAAGNLQEIKIKTGAIANTCSKLIIGLYYREGENPKNNETGTLKPSTPLVELIWNAKPGTKATLSFTLITPLEIEPGVPIYLALLPIGGNFHYTCQNTTGKILKESTTTGHTSIERTTWTGGEGNGPIEAEGLGELTTPGATGAAWLGLMGNHMTNYGVANEYAKHRIVWDRGNELEPVAGAQAPGTAASLAAGCIPIIIIEDNEGASGKMPETAEQIKLFAEKCVETIKKEREAFPTSQLIFNILNEPYFRTENTAAKYAAILVEVYAKLEAAGQSINNIIAEGRGKEWIKEMYTAQPSLETKVWGWGFHPYGGQNGVGTSNWNQAGIQSLPTVRAEIKEGRNNIFVTEIGWWVSGVNGAVTPEPPEAASQEQAKEWIEAAMKIAQRYVASGWLKSFLLYSRIASGWSMEEPGAKQTKSGEAITKFADQLSIGPFPQPVHTSTRVAMRRSAAR